MKYKTRSKTRTRIVKDVRVRISEEYPWKILGWLAEDLSQYLDESELNHITEVVRNRDLNSYLELSEAWGLQCTTPMDTNLASLRAKYQLAALLKKFQFKTEKDERIQAALIKFYAAERSCREYNLNSYSKLSWAKDSWMVDVFTYARCFMQKLLGIQLPSGKIMTEWSRHGPGASLDTVSSQGTSQYYKFANWPYSCTLDAYRYARFTIETDVRWFGALQNDYRRRFNIPKHFPINMQLFWTRVIRIVDGNRITFVPKNAKIERSIAIEPALNLYLQLGVDGFIRRRLKRWGVDLDSQTKNQELAFKGSLQDGDDSFVTIDLASASDCISLKLCQLLLPYEWYSYLLAIRSPVGIVFDEKISYEKISSMGNGFTFALESAIFTSIIYGVMKAVQGDFDSKEFAVFGDDLIVRKALSEKVIEALSNCGFTINSEKSFLQGPVRESCGTDWFRGKPLRPVFFSDLPSTVMELFTDYNRLKRLLYLRWGLEESKCLTLMEKWIPEKFAKLSGPLSNEDFDSYKHSAQPLNAVYNYCLWKYQRLVIQPLPIKKCDNFHIRKLMHNLRESPPIQKWDRRKEKGAGSRFTVTKRSLLAVRQTYSVSDVWTSEYAE